MPRSKSNHTKSEKPISIIRWKNVTDRNSFNAAAFHSQSMMFMPDQMIPSEKFFWPDNKEHKERNILGGVPFLPLFRGASTMLRHAAPFMRKASVERTD
ncbi:hypothetical protein [uncultured Mailhella sp.]|uniref:hypothetical protein n=1 Tax=uncultured Mailhella sp. TaxID=1981031 RepID=UPI0025FA89B9|nr:hypothetical protein [uncultured Mailhella sp.]